MSRVQLEHRLAEFLAFADVCRFGNLRLVTADIRIGGLVEGVLHVSDEFSLQAGTSPFYGGQNNPDEAESGISLLSYSGDVGECIIETSDSKRFRNCRQQEIVSRFVRRDGWNR